MVFAINYNFTSQYSVFFLLLSGIYNLMAGIFRLWGCAVFLPVLLLSIGRIYSFYE